MDHWSVRGGGLVEDKARRSRKQLWCRAKTKSTVTTELGLVQQMCEQEKQKTLKDSWQVKEAEGLTGIRTRKKEARNHATQAVSVMYGV